MGLADGSVLYFIGSTDLPENLYLDNHVVYRNCGRWNMDF